MVKFNLRALLTLPVLALLASGCGGNGSSQDEGMWGVRHVRGLFDDEEEVVEEEVIETTVVGDDGTAIETMTTYEETTTRTSYDAEPELPEDPDFARATELVKEQRFAEAKQLLLQVVKRYPQNSSAWRWLGDCYYNILELPESIDAYRKALLYYPENYYALRGEGFALLHYGHDLWRKGNRAEAHAQYRNALKILQNCLKIYPADAEAMYGRAMAAEGASRKLYQNVILFQRQNKPQQALAEARICISVINEGINAAQERIKKMPDEVGARSIAGGLYQRLAMLFSAIEQQEKAVETMEYAVQTYESIIKLNPDNVPAQKELQNARAKLDAWRASLAMNE